MRKRRTTGSTPASSTGSLSGAYISHRAATKHGFFPQLTPTKTSPERREPQRKPLPADHEQQRDEHHHDHHGEQDEGAASVRDRRDDVHVLSRIPLGRPVPGWGSPAGQECLA